MCRSARLPGNDLRAVAVIPRRVELSLRSGDVRALPDTLLNGAMKSGTSSRRYYLTQHPLVIPPLRSEAHQCFSCLARGGHAGQRERWLQFYPREQLLILHFEDLARDPLLLTDESLVCTGLSPMSSAKLEPRHTGSTRRWIRQRRNGCGTTSCHTMRRWRRSWAGRYAGSRRLRDRLKFGQHPNASALYRSLRSDSRYCASSGGNPARCAFHNAAPSRSIMACSASCTSPSLAASERWTRAMPAGRSVATCSRMARCSPCLLYTSPSPRD